MMQRIVFGWAEELKDPFRMKIAVRAVTNRV
jgi:hypothetical protein